MKFAYVLLDGCGDRPDARLNYTTPLDAAQTPNLDRISFASRLGSVVTVGRGVAPESDIAVFNMLGYSFPKGYAGRGVIEAVGSGIDFEDGQLALRANLGTLSGRNIIDRRAGRDLTDEEAKELEGDLMAIELKDASFEFRATVSYRGVLVIRSGETLSASITNTDPAYVRVSGFGAARAVSGAEPIARSRPETRTPEAKRSARLVNEFTAKAMKALAHSAVNRRRSSRGQKPANCVLLRDGGDHLPEVESFRTKYGMHGTALVEMPAEVGIAKLLKMRMVEMRDRNDLVGKAEAFAREISDGTMVYVHIKGPDEFGHDGDAVGKKREIERIDGEFFSNLARMLGEVGIAVSCDHSTPAALGSHSSDPVPFAATVGRRADSLRFTEANSRRGSLGPLMGRNALATALAAYTE
jgi:2,3-bisphosphoglycerate-independent phosphoglycerate mutase